MNNNNNNNNYDNNDNLTHKFVPGRSAVPFTQAVADFAAVYTITAPDQVLDQARQPIDVVCVVDRSGSMSQHMPMLRDTLKFVTSQLQEGDNLCIVSYHSEVTTNVPFTRIGMRDGSKQRINDIIDTLRDEGCTNLSGGLFEGLHQVESARRSQLATVLLLTDGLANEGIVECGEILRRMRNRDFIRSFESAASASSKRLGGTLVDDLATPSCSVYTFGFGQNHNVDMLTRIAEVGRGLYSYIKTAEDIGAAFAAALGGLMSTVAQTIEIEFEHGVTARVSKVVSKYTVTPTPDGYRVSLPDMLANESRDIVCMLSVQAVPDALAVEPVCTAQLRYYHRLKEREVRADACILALHRPAPADMQPHMSAMNVGVDAQLNRVKVVEAMDTAAALADDNKIVEARRTIDVALASIRESVSRDEASVQQLMVDLQKCRDGLRDVREYQSSGSKVMKAMFMGHSKQRANMQCMDAYSAPAQKSAMKKWFSSR